jgi:hypothetical protein
MIFRFKSSSSLNSSGSIRSFSTLDPVKFNRLRRCIPNYANGTHLRGRNQTSYDFEKRIRLIAADSRQCVAWPIKNLYLNDNNNHKDSQKEEEESGMLFFDPTTTVIADVITKEELELGRIFRPHPMALYSIANNNRQDRQQQQNEPIKISTSTDLEIETIEGFDEEVATFDSNKKRRLQKDGDTNLLQVPIKIIRNDSQEIVETTANVIQVIEPDVRDVSFQKMEAQIELITAFRNVLMDFFELSCPSSSSSSAFSCSSFSSPKKFNLQEKPKFSTLRVPPLSLAFHGGKFDYDIEKMHHAALIQAFHRCAGDVKDWFAIHHDLITVELFVPRAMIESFNRAFYESGEAWETPESALIPTKFNMYPGLQMPASLLESAPGFIGKREEIKALALPYEERIKRLGEIDEANFQKKLLEYQEQEGQPKLEYLGSTQQDDDGEKLKIESETVISTANNDGDDEDVTLRIRMVSVKPANRKQGGGVENIFK